LRVLQEQEFERLGSARTQRVDVRVVAATNCSLEEMVADRQFRGDLFYRLNVFPITLPPLRERREDIPLLVRFFAQKFSQRMPKRIDTIPAESLAALTHYHWPGNIRELENLIERAVILPVEGVLASEVMNAARARLTAFAKALPPGSRMEIGGEEEEQVKGFKNLAVVLMISVAAIYLALIKEKGHLAQLTGPPSLSVADVVERAGRGGKGTRINRGAAGRRGSDPRQSVSTRSVHSLLLQLWIKQVAAGLQKAEIAARGMFGTGLRCGHSSRHHLHHDLQPSCPFGDAVDHRGKSLWALRIGQGDIARRLHEPRRCS
jgi:hypothetical protein